MSAGKKDGKMNMSSDGRDTSKAMDHREYIRISENRGTAVLMIHGIAGTPAHFRDLIPLIPEEWSVYNILLDGHGKEVRDFGATSMKKWKAQVDARLEEIMARHDRVIIVTHSMGGLFAIQSAICYPEKIAQLFLLVLPLKVFLRPVVIASSLRIMLGMVRIEKNVNAEKKGGLAGKVTATVAERIKAPRKKATRIKATRDRKTSARIARMMVDDCSIRLTGRFWEYIPWLFRMIELLWEIRETRMVIHQLAVPCETYQSRRDELVSMGSCKYLEGHPYIRNMVMENSGHFGYEGKDRELLIERFREMVERQR